MHVPDPDVVARLERAAACIGRAPSGPPRGTVRAGVDLGTASCVLVVLDDDEPVWVDAHPSGALRDGVVVDFAAATGTVRELRRRAEEALGTRLTSVATAYPPLVPESDARACRFVCETAGFADVVLVDEVTAAQHTLRLRDGVVVDVGGGSTGVGVFRDGVLVALDDRPGGGHHLDLIVAGATGVPVEEAERMKRLDPEGVFALLVPGLERIAESVRSMTRDAEDLPLHLAGGALMVPGADRVIAARLGRKVVAYPHALLATPLGIAGCAA